MFKTRQPKAPALPGSLHLPQAPCEPRCPPRQGYRGALGARGSGGGVVGDALSAPLPAQRGQGSAAEGPPGAREPTGPPPQPPAAVPRALLLAPGTGGRPISLDMAMVSRPAELSMSCNLISLKERDSGTLAGVTGGSACWAEGCSILLAVTEVDNCNHLFTSLSKHMVATEPENRSNAR